MRRGSGVAASQRSRQGRWRAVPAEPGHLRHAQALRTQCLGLVQLQLAQPLLRAPALFAAAPGRKLRRAQMHLPGQVRHFQPVVCPAGAGPVGQTGPVDGTLHAPQAWHRAGGGAPAFQQQSGAGLLRLRQSLAAGIGQVAGQGPGGAGGVLLHRGPAGRPAVQHQAAGAVAGFEIVPLADLCRFGVPDWIGNFQNPDFPALFADYARAFATRFPWVQLYTPVNEMYICALFSARYGWWNEQLMRSQMDWNHLT